MCMYLVLLCIVCSQIGGVHNWSTSFNYRLSWIDLLLKWRNQAVGEKEHDKESNLDMLILDVSNGTRI